MDLPSFDYNLTTAQQRIKYVQDNLKKFNKKEIPSKYLNACTDYILFTSDKGQAKKEQNTDCPILVKNREITVFKRETSFENLAAKLERGEDGVYALMCNDKNKIMDHKEPISEEDLKRIPQLNKYFKVIKSLQKQFEKAQSTDKFALKKQLIEAWQQLYLIKASYIDTPARAKSLPVEETNHLHLFGDTYLDENDYPQSTGLVSLFNVEHVSAILALYPQLLQECENDINSDIHWLLLDFQKLLNIVFKDKPILKELLELKMMGYTNADISKKIKEKYNISYNYQYFSTLWRNRIPKLIVEEAQRQYLIWYYSNHNTGTWKKCGKCGKNKLAHPLFFSKNNSQDTYYSICKECRSQQSKKGKNNDKAPR